MEHKTVKLKILSGKKCIFFRVRGIIGVKNVHLIIKENTITSFKKYTLLPTFRQGLKYDATDDLS